MDFFDLIAYDLNKQEEKIMTSEKKMPEHNLPMLSDFLCFATYSANLAFHRMYKKVLVDTGLTYTQLVTMVALNEEANQTVSQLGQKLYLSSNTLTPLLKQLEKMGYIERERSKKDERQVMVNLTEKGRDLPLRSACEELYHATGLTMDEVVVLRSAMQKLRDNLLSHVDD